MKSKTLRLISLLVLIAFGACTAKAPILFYKDESERNPRCLQLKAGLLIENVQEALKAVNIKTPIFPIFSYFKAEFPKTKQAEFLSDMIRQYFLDSGIFNYVYNYPFENEDIDIIVNLRLNKFKLYNDKLVANLTTYGNLVIPIGAMFVFKSLGMQLAVLSVAVSIPIFITEIYNVEYDFYVELMLPDGKKINGYEAQGKGKKTLGALKDPYGEYLYYRSIFKKVFLKVMDEIKDKILADREKIIQAYRGFLLK